MLPGHCLRQGNSAHRRTPVLENVAGCTRAPRRARCVYHYSERVATVKRYAENALNLSSSCSPSSSSFSSCSAHSSTRHGALRDFISRVQLGSTQPGPVNCQFNSSLAPLPLLPPPPPTVKPSTRTHLIFLCKPFSPLMEWITYGKLMHDGRCRHVLAWPISLQENMVHSNCTLGNKSSVYSMCFLEQRLVVYLVFMCVCSRVFVPLHVLIST